MQDIACRCVNIIFVLVKIIFSVSTTLEKLPKKDPALHPA